MDASASNPELTPGVVGGVIGHTKCPIMQTQCESSASCTILYVQLFKLSSTFHATLFIQVSGIVLISISMICYDEQKICDDF